MKPTYEQLEAALRAIIAEDEKPQDPNNYSQGPDWYAAIGWCANIAREALRIDGPGGGE